MSRKHPIVAVTGAPGAGLSTVRHAFKDIFARLGIRPAIVHGDAFRRFGATEQTALEAAARAAGRELSRFGPDNNLFDELQALFRDYGDSGRGRLRDYAHNAERAGKLGVGVGEFGAWRRLPAGSDLLFYEGQHGGLATARAGSHRAVDTRHFPPGMAPRGKTRDADDGIDIARHVDLLIGVTPTINLEWIQKIHRDAAKYRRSPDETVRSILSRMEDAIRYIVPQFALTDLNIQRVPLVDTSNPFVARDVPAPEESALIFHFRDRKRHDFPDLLKRIPGARMTRASTLLVPGGKLRQALAVICAPMLEDMMLARKRALARA
jgi:phosphoribulokinase